MRGLIIQTEPINLILDGKKIWEIRGSRTNIQEHIALIEGGTGTVVGVCELSGCIGPLSMKDYRKNARKMGKKPSEVPSKRPYKGHPYAWLLSDAKRLKKPVPYTHPPGAVIWVHLNQSAVRAISRQQTVLISGKQTA